MELEILAVLQEILKSTNILILLVGCLVGVTIFK